MESHKSDEDGGAGEETAQVAHGEQNQRAAGKAGDQKKRKDGGHD